MKENFFLVGLFFIFAPVLILAQTFLITKLDIDNYQTIVPLLTDSGENQLLTYSTGSIFSSHEVDESKLDSSIISADARPFLIKKYLQKYNSVLVPYADLIFSVSQKNGLDYRLITAIAQQESNLCKKAPENCFNCWGVGIHSRGTMCFDSYTEGINWVGKYLKEEYHDIGLNSVEEIMGKYCPLSSGSWAEGVKHIMADIEKND